MEPTIQKQSFKSRFKQNISILKEIYALIVLHKKWWLLPIYFVFALVSLLMVLAGGGGVLPAIYALF